jgi:DNA-3-methyladenine glycosylase
MQNINNSEELIKNRLPRAFYNRDAVTVAKDLLGKYLVHIEDGVARVGRIVEVEAYLGEHDLAAHSCKGLTPRTKVMFGPPGFAYVYLIYGMHHCMNVVIEGEGKAAAVLLRAVEPVKNITLRTQGPGLLCKAMGITKTQNAQDLTSDHFFIVDSGADEKIQIIKKPRIGVDYAGEWAKKLLRFYIKDSTYISRK